MSRRDRSERGFTVIEVMIALLVLLLGMAGILTLQLTSVEATSFSRHATEATVLAEDKMEELRTVPLSALVPGSDPEPVDSRGFSGVSQAIYTRSWSVRPGPVTEIAVTVAWMEKGEKKSEDASEAYVIRLETGRKR